MKEEKIYDCACCLNAGTPLCELCTQIESPTGEENKPTQYQTATGGGKLSKELAALSNRIALRLYTGNPVQLSWIIRYNKLVTNDK